MLISARNLNEIEQNSSDVLIVGAGAVGLTMAIDFARLGKSVILLEAGPLSVSKVSQRFFESATSIGRLLEGLHLGRFRAVGGTTHFWGGQLVRFDSIVFGKREWVGVNANWPIKRDDIEPFYDRALEMLGMGKASIDDHEVMSNLNISPPSMSEKLSLFFTRWTPEANFSRLFEKEIRSLPNLRVIYDAPVVALIPNSIGDEIAGVEIAVDGKHRIKFCAKHVVLANGTIEMVRLLLLPYTDGRLPPWINNIWLGRGFMDHVDCVVGEVFPIDKRKFHLLFDNAFLDGIKYQPKIKLSEVTQQQEELLGVACHFIFNSSIAEHIVNAKIFLKALVKGRIDGSILDIPRQVLTIVMVGVPMILRYLRYRRMYNPADQGIQLRLTVEQVMLVDSCLKLKSEKDALGMPLVEMNWKVNGCEINTIARFSEIVKDYLFKSGLAEVRINERLMMRDSSFMNSLDDANHHMGMVRMADDPKEGVVDKNLKVYGTGNLYVAGAAVYPSTGFANPTFTAIALGLRLSEHLMKLSSK